MNIVDNFWVHKSALKSFLYTLRKLTNIDGGSGKLRVKTRHTNVVSNYVSEMTNIRVILKPRLIPNYA